MGPSCEVSRISCDLHKGKWGWPRTSKSSAARLLGSMLRHSLLSASNGLQSGGCIRRSRQVESLLVVKRNGDTNTSSKGYSPWLLFFDRGIRWWESPHLYSAVHARTSDHGRVEGSERNYTTNRKSRNSRNASYGQDGRWTQADKNSGRFTPFMDAMKKIIIDM